MKLHFPLFYLQRCFSSSLHMINTLFTFIKIKTMNFIVNKYNILINLSKLPWLLCFWCAYSICWIGQVRSVRSLPVLMINNRSVGRYIFYHYWQWSDTTTSSCTPVRMAAMNTVWHQNNYISPWPNSPGSFEKIQHHLWMPLFIDSILLLMTGFTYHT